MSTELSTLASFSCPCKCNATEPSATTVPSFRRSDATTLFGTFNLDSDPSVLSSAAPVFSTPSKRGKRKDIASSEPPLEATTSLNVSRAAP